MIRSAANSIYYAHKQALLQAAEVDALRRGLSPELQRVGLSMWRAVLAAWKDRTPHVDIQGVLERKALGPLVDGALNAHAIGWKSAQQTPDDATPIRFSILKETLATLKDAGDIDALQSQYKVDCLRMLTKASNSAEAALRDKMNDLISRGAHTRDGIKELATVFEAQGLSSNARMLETIFRTQHQLAYAAGRWRADQDSDVADFIWGYRYTIVGGPDGDGRNRPSHIKLNGVTLPKDDPFWKTHWPPNGWNCRCQAVQVWKKATVVAAPKGVEPDKGFSFNSGEIFSPAVDAKKEGALVVRPPAGKSSEVAKPKLTRAQIDSVVKVEPLPPETESGVEARLRSFADGAADVLHGYAHPTTGKQIEIPVKYDPNSIHSATGSNAGLTLSGGATSNNIPKTAAEFHAAEDLQIRLFREQSKRLLAEAKTKKERDRIRRELIQNEEMYELGKHASRFLIAGDFSGDEYARVIGRHEAAHAIASVFGIEHRSDLNSTLLNSANKIGITPIDRAGVSLYSTRDLDETFAEAMAARASGIKLSPKMSAWLDDVLETSGINAAKIKSPTVAPPPTRAIESTTPQPSVAAKQATIANYYNKKVDPQVTAAALKDLGIDPTKKENRGIFSIAQHQQLIDGGKSNAKLYRFKDGTTAPVETIDGIAWAHTPDGAIPLRTLLDRLGLPLDRYATPQEYIDYLSEKGLLGGIAAALQWVGRLVGKTFGLGVAGKVPKQ